MLPTTTLTWHDLVTDRPLDRFWNAEGVLIAEKLIDDDLLDRYEREWEAANGFEGIGAGGRLVAANPSGYRETEYMHRPALMELCTDSRIAGILEELVGEPAGVHLNLSGWVSTERSWHMDYYLNELCVGDHYAAVWIALEDVHPDSGPFQYIPGSHTMGCIEKASIGRHVNLADPMWPKHSEDVLEPIVAEMIATGTEAVTHLPKRGDVLFWHPRLLHQGSRAIRPGMARHALIAHYSGLTHRSDMRPAIQSEHGGWYFPF